MYSAVSEPILIAVISPSSEVRRTGVFLTIKLYGAEN